jgi:ribosomal small subunit protein bTHX
MGRGDQRTKRGKISRGTYGKTRLKLKARKQAKATKAAGAKAAGNA